MAATRLAAAPSDVSEDQVRENESGRELNAHVYPRLSLTTRARAASLSPAQAIEMLAACQGCSRHFSDFDFGQLASSARPCRETPCSLSLPFSLTRRSANPHAL